MFKIAVCDDEPVYLEKIINSIRRILDERGISTYQIDTYSEGEVLLEDDKVFDYNVIFLDINMPQISGLEVAEKIRESRQDILLIFVTAFLDYAIEGYRMEAIRFLLKDMLDELLPECMETIIKKLDMQTHKINKHFMEGKKELSVDSIWYVESQRHKLFFHIFEIRMVRYSLYEKLDNIEKELQKYRFLRIHKGFLVNTKYIESISNYRVLLKDGRILPVPRDKYQKVKERYYEIMGDMI